MILGDHKVLSKKRKKGDYVFKDSDKELRKDEKRKLKALKTEQEGKLEQKSVNINRRRWRVLLLWFLFLASGGFGLYRNFSAINTHTIYHETVVDSRVESLSGIENFVSRFAHVFFSNTYADGDLSVRSERLSSFVTDEFLRLNNGMFGHESTHDVMVSDVAIWDVKQYDEFYFEVLFSVLKRIESRNDISLDDEFNDYELHFDDELDDYFFLPTPIALLEETEDGSNQLIESAYRVLVYVDDVGNMVVLSTTLASMPSRAGYAASQPTRSMAVDVEVRQGAIQFLTLFFEIYPNATSAQIAFYVRDEVLEPIERDLSFERFLEYSFWLDDEDALWVDVVVIYVDQLSGMNLTSSYRLMLEEVNDNFMIVNR